MRRLTPILALLSTPALAQAPATTPPRVVEVSGNGEVATPPDIATVAFTVVGEGRTPDEATAALAAKHKAVVAGLAGLLGADTAITASEVSTQAATSPGCERYGPARLSEGNCAVAGHVATLSGQARTRAVTKAGTAAGLAQRLGARDARIAGFELADQATARRRAIAAAIAEARTRAAALADGLGQRLGPVVRISDQQARDPVEEIVVTGARLPPPPPPPPPAPIAIDITPRPIETRAQVYVTFSLEG